jgi:site-specific recombinase XerD
MTETIRVRGREDQSGQPPASPPDSRGQTLGATPWDVGEVILERLKDIGLADQSLPRIADTVTRFTIYLEQGHHLRSVHEISREHVEGFIFAPLPDSSGRRRPAIATMHLRRSALRIYFRIARQEGLCPGDPTLDLRLPPRSGLAMRPLSSDEIVLCRSYSLKTLTATRLPAALALAEATARTSEIPHTLVSDVEMEGKRVWLHGSPKTEPRWGYPSEWGLHQLVRRIETLKAATCENRPLIYRGNGSEQSRQAASCIAITETLERAGLAQEPDVRPLSIVAWAGRCAFSATGRIDEVARRTGMRSLDRAARLISWDWTDDYDDTEERFA